MPKVPTVRTGRPFIPPVKPMKTERTHEENQERAYVAASRRSDRSLEARVESARRASEIHKRRTGRGFKITQEGVEKEEMYEEEDDLPLRYRQVANHLHNPNQITNLDHRINAYLTANIAMREQVIKQMNSQQQQQQQPQPASGYSNPAQFANPQYAGPQLANQTTIPNNVQQSQYLAMQQSMRQQCTAIYRPAPYQVPRQQGLQPTQHQRSASFASPMAQVQHSPVVPVVDHRRMSMPAVIPPEPGSPGHVQTPGGSMQSMHSSPMTGPAMFSRQSSGYTQQQSVSPAQQQQPYSVFNNMSEYPPNYSPFTAQLPSNAQGLLGSALNPNDPYTSMLMAGSGNLVSSFYNFDASQQQTFQNVGGQQTHATLDGLGTTLAQSAYEMQSPGFEQQSGLDHQTQTQDQTFFNEAFTGFKSGDATPAATPEDSNTWDLFNFEELQSSQSSQQ